MVSSRSFLVAISSCFSRVSPKPPPDPRRPRARRRISPPPPSRAAHTHKTVEPLSLIANAPPPQGGAFFIVSCCGPQRMPPPDKITGCTAAYSSSSVAPPPLPRQLRTTGAHCPSHCGLPSPNNAPPPPKHAAAPSIVCSVAAQPPNNTPIEPHSRVSPKRHGQRSHPRSYLGQPPSPTPWLATEPSVARPPPPFPQEHRPLHRPILPNPTARDHPPTLTTPTDPLLHPPKSSSHKSMGAVTTAALILCFFFWGGGILPKTERLINDDY